MNSKTLIIGLAASILSGCATYTTVGSKAPSSEYRQRWDALSATYGEPAKPFKVLFADALKNLAYTQAELNKQEVVNEK